MPTTTTNQLEKIDEEIKKLYKQRDKQIEKEFGSLIGQCYHPPGLDVFIYVKAIKGRNVEAIEINNGDIFNANRNYEDQIFSSQYLASRTQFKERLKQIYNQHLMELE